MNIYIYNVLYTNLSVNTLVRLPHPRSGAKARKRF